MTDVLSSSLKPIQRVVREHEVLRVAGWILGDNVEENANTAIREVLKWAQKRCGGQLPPEAWDRQSFDYLAGGRNSNCVRLKAGNSDIWTVRTDDPDKNVAERVWSTEVVIGSILGEQVKFSVRLLVSTPEHDLKIEPATPGLVFQIANACSLMSGSQRMSAEPMIFETSDDGADLVAHLTDEARKLPTIILTQPDETANLNGIDAIDLAKALLGISHVAVAHPAATWKLTNEFGKFRSVFGGAARVYMPKFSAESDPYSHRLVLANQLDTPEAITRATRWMRQLAAQESIRTARLGREVLPFASIRNANLELRQKTLRHENASEGEQLAAANDRLTELEKQIEALAAEQEYYVQEYEKERARAEISEGQGQKATYRIQQLTEQLKAQDGDPDEAISLPIVWPDLADWCDVQLAGRLVLTPMAHRSIRKPLYQDVKTAARCLLWLATECRDQRINGGNPLSNIPIFEGIQNAPCGADTYDFGWSERSLSADWHVKSGGNTRDPARCLRIYYCFDPQTQQIIVSEMPAHRRTAAS